MSKIKLFFTSLGATTIILLVIIFSNRPPHLEFHQVAPDVFVSSQLQIKDLASAQNKGIRTVVDLRPDGEASDQPSSEKMKDFAQVIGMGFYYIPVPHEEIPDKAVADLAGVLAHQPKPFVLYCRTGRRAARTFALVEASRDNGPGWVEINKMVVDAGFTADDLKNKILDRIAKRKPIQSARN